MKRKIIPYNSKLKELAKQLRQNMTLSEVKLWNELKNGQLMGYDFDRQRPIGNYIVDLFCKDLQLALEVDGITHLDEKVIETLKQQGEASSNDGMDISLISYDLKKKELAFAGAKRSLFLFRKNERKEFKGDKFPIGSSQYGTSKVFR